MLFRLGFIFGSSLPSNVSEDKYRRGNEGGNDDEDDNDDGYIGDGLSGDPIDG